MGETLSERVVTVTPALAGELAGLLAWDAPFLPDVVRVEGTADRVTIECHAAGQPLTAIAGWPRGARAAAALQLVACGAFLVERGFLPVRSLLRQARVTRDARAVRLRLSSLPLLHAESVRSSVRLRNVVRAEGALLGRLLSPLVEALLPERSPRLQGALRRCAPWEAGPALVAELMAENRGGSVLVHSGGAGRALWARRFAVPTSGVHWIEGEDIAAGLSAAILLASAARGRPTLVKFGPLDEDDVARVQAEASMAEMDSVVLTTIPVEGALPLALGEVEALWVLAPQPTRAHEHVRTALDVGRERPILAREVVEAGAAAAFTRPPASPAAAAGRVTMASPSARRLLQWLEAAPAGLSEDELSDLEKRDAGALAELSRLGLAFMRDGAWHAVEPRSSLDRQRLGALAKALRRDSPRRLLAEALLGTAGSELSSWCERQLEASRAREVYAVARPAAALWPMPLLAAEAALLLGRLAEAERHLQAVGKSRRQAVWHLLTAWWAVTTNVVPLANDELRLVSSDGLPPRLAARLAWIEAQLAFLRGARDVERQWLARASRIAPLSVPDAVTEIAADRGGGALRRAREVLAAAWHGDTVACALYTLAARAWFRASYPAAATALRAALRVATGHNPKLVGEIHADLGSSALQADRPEAAERHLLLAEQWLERAGSRRAATVVRFNRGTLANDLLDWPQARHLVVSARELRGGAEGVSSTLEDLELARCDLVRGDFEAVSVRLPALDKAISGVADRVGLAQGLAALRAHLALAVGDLQAAETAAGEADESERELILAVIRADRGVPPRPGLPRRWGVSVTAELLHAWQRGEEERAREALSRALAAAPREAALGFVRFAACIRRRGDGLGPGWSRLRVDAERLLERAGLGGWAAQLRRGLGPDTLEVVRALEEVLGSGSDALGAERVSRLARALGLDALHVSWEGGSAVRFGSLPADGEEITVGGLTAQVGGAVSEVARSALVLVLRQLPGLLGGREMRSGGTASSLLGSSSALAAVREQVARWAPLPAPVLLTGEPGTGKELVARELHGASGRKGAFVAVNCAGMPATLLESELFGVARGAFTGADRDRSGLVEAAEGGTLFLDEVGELPVELQAKLLRLLQEREVRRVGATASRKVDVRFIAATNRDLAASIAAGTFRQDLYYRLAYAVIETPPLRDRPDDIEVLAVHFTAELARSFQRPGVRLSPAALSLLRQGRWAGNVRELESCLARAVAAARPGEILGPDRFAEVAARPRAAVPSWADALSAFRRSYFSDILEEAGGNRSLAARRAGISRQTLLHHLKELGLGDRSDG